VVGFTPRPLYSQGKSLWYPLDRRLGGSQSRSGRGGEEKNSQSPQGIIIIITNIVFCNSALLNLCTAGHIHGSDTSVHVFVDRVACANAYRQCISESIIIYVL
jgi:hypothetical protein